MVAINLLLTGIVSKLSTAVVGATLPTVVTSLRKVSYVNLVISIFLLNVSIFAPL